MKLEVEFDNYDESRDTYIPLRKADVVLNLEGHGAIVPVSMFDNRHATYELPEGATEEDLVAALETCSWSFTGISDVRDDPEMSP